MDEYDVKRLALIFAVQAEVEGMGYENIIRKQNQKSMAYGYGDFQSKAEELRNLAYAPNEKL